MNRAYLIVVVCVAFILSSCSNKELEKLRNENQQLETKVQTLEQENAKLKETADYHYQQGADRLSSQEYEEAKSEFETVIEKYPTSPFVPSAKQQLSKVKTELVRIEAQKIAEERRKQEEEKYRPRSTSEAIQEWIQFRKSRDDNYHPITTWRVQIEIPDDHTQDPLGILCDRGSYDQSYKVRIAAENGGSYYWNSLPHTTEKDWVVVTGKLYYVTSGNEIKMLAYRVKNEGY